MQLPSWARLLDGFWTPLRDPTYWRKHSVPHLIGGAIYWCVATLIPGIGVGERVLVAGVMAMYRQEILREVDPANFPVWAILWDVAAVVVGATVMSFVF